MSTQVDPQSHDEQRTSQEVTAPRGSEDEAIAAFNQRHKSQAQNEPETPEDEPQDDPAPEPEEGEPEGEDEPAETLVEVEYEGEKHKLPPKLKDALLRQADYSRRMAEVSETKKDYAQRIESADKLIEAAEKLAEAKATIRALDVQIKSFEGVDFDKLESENPAQASLLALKLMRLQQSRDAAVASEQSVADTVAAQRQKDTSAKQAEMLKVLAKDFPGWGEDAGTKVTQYALKSGWQANEIRDFTDSRLVIVLDKARKFDAIQDGKKEAVNKAREAQPVAKPGAPRRPNPSNDAMQRFQKSTSPEDAVAVFMARAAVKQR
jgi:hypothetical protein